MKAAVVFKKGEAPQYTENFPEPVAQDEGQVVLAMKAAAVKHLDKLRASGRHYSSGGDVQEAKAVGGDGVGLLPDGTRVFAFGSGTIAEKALISKDRIIPLPQGISDAAAAALPNGIAGSAMALRFRAGIRPGETVLINGATGFTGRLAVQVAKHYGAGRVIATGRNEASLQSLRSLGADEVLSLGQSDEQILAQLKAIRERTPVDIIVDYVWGRSAELILESLKGNGTCTHRTRYVSVGSMSGGAIRLPSEILRSVDLQLSGSGLGSWTESDMRELFVRIIPEMLQLAADGKLQVETVSMPLQDVEKAWELDIAGGKRLVVVM